ncbi:response regulator transcription factor [Nesterenkonia pannonica]|uniref:response regulator n=1 Tax=Nesterenkonia pannonica TaxID=1548602 RepID=UPI0021640CF3|nr:response regulator transcription factor [Nesterenkonia pannonica]
MQITVAMVDDDPLVLDSLRRILSEHSDLSLVGTASTGVDALQLVRTVRPDVVLMDLQLRGEMDGVEATRAPQLPEPARCSCGHQLRHRGVHARRPGSRCRRVPAEERCRRTPRLSDPDGPCRDPMISQP